MTEDYRSNAEQFVEGVERAARPYWPLLIVEGIALILFGVLAVFIPPLITIGIASSLSWVFIFGGLAALFVYFRLYRPTGFRQGLFLAVLSVIAGVALLIRPLSGISCSQSSSLSVLPSLARPSSSIHSNGFSISQAISHGFGQAVWSISCWRHGCLPTSLRPHFGLPGSCWGPI